MRGRPLDILNRIRGDRPYQRVSNLSNAEILEEASRVVSVLEEHDGNLQDNADAGLCDLRALLRSLAARLTSVEHGGGCKT